MLSRQPFPIRERVTRKPIRADRLRGARDRAAAPHPNKRRCVRILTQKSVAVRGYICLAVAAVGSVTHDADCS